jgi:hypothetical protein
VVEVAGGWVGELCGTVPELGDGSAELESGQRELVDGWAPMVLDFFPIYSKPSQLKKIKMGALYYSNNSEFLHVARMGYNEQFSQFW